MTAAELDGLTIATLAELLRTRQVSPVEVTRDYLERIEVFNGAVNAYVTVIEDRARDDARRAEEEIRQGHYRGPLHGVPIAHKDLYLTEGVRTTAASRVLADFVPDRDATVVSRYRAAGTVLLGKLNMHEFAYGTTNKSSSFGPVHNPWDLTRHSGGSSGGSAAAVLMSMCAAATGSDSGGSIRMPAAACGIVGLKPTFGLGSRHGIVPLMWTADHPGPMTRTVRDAALMLPPVAGYDPRDRTTVDRPPVDYLAALTGDIAGLRVGVPSHYFYDRAQPTVEGIVRTAVDELAGLGAQVQEVDLPYVEYAAAASITMHLAEAAAYHDDTFTAAPELYTAETRQNIELGNYVLAKDYLQAQRYRHLLGQSFLRAFSQVDVLVTPTLPLTATPIPQERITIRDVDQLIHLAMLRNTEPMDLTGLPALSVPCGFAEGLPVGLQIIGPAFGESTVLRVGDAYQRVTSWHQRRAPLAAEDGAPGE